MCFIPTSYRRGLASIAIFSTIKQSNLIAPTNAEINSKTETTRATIEKHRTIERSRNRDCSIRDFTTNPL
ncbi:hypothetical protein [Microcoleus sp. N9_A4]|uniref:hypothetical protein n=1 Tax=Microcoleus sp. N9_A4 TaxID=3055383 RepID=UPI002FD0D56F